MEDGGRQIGRVAFVTPEYLTEGSRSGGIANYVAKMAKALTSRGIASEVFVPSRQPEVISVDGVRVERVQRERSFVARGVARALRPALGARTQLILNVLNARRLARALEHRHLDQPFDVVQSSNHNLTGYFVRAVPGRRNVIRISTSRRLYDQAAGHRHTALSRLTEALDVRAIRRADVAYAPSRFLADYFNTTYGTDVRVLRPPAELGTAPATDIPGGLPERYLIHFGSLGARKGTDLVAEALHLAWRVDPSLRMVWAGSLDERALARFRRGWGEAHERVTVLGALEKAALYAVLTRAVAAVLPSTVDNLPNTVIESLALGVPVIGSDGASIDELVEDGLSGALVPLGDAEALAAVMVEAWQGRPSWLQGGFRAPATLLEMHPDEAVRRFIALAAAPGDPDR